MNRLECLKLLRAIQAVNEAGAELLDCLKRISVETDLSKEQEKEQGLELEKLIRIHERTINSLICGGKGGDEPPNCNTKEKES